MVAACCHPRENVAKLWLIADELQQRFTPGTFLADSQDTFGRGIEANDQQRVIKKDDARTQAVENLLGAVIEAAATRPIVIVVAVATFVAGWVVTVWL